MSISSDMAIDISTITAFHQLRQNTGWPSDSEDQRSALAKALDYQVAFYPVRAVLTPEQQAIYTNAIAMLALEMVSAPAVRSAQAIKKLKEQSSSGAQVETEYEASTTEQFPQIAAMLAPLAPRAASESAAVRFSRMRP